MSYYVMPWGRTVTFKLWDSNGKKIGEAHGRQRGLEPITLPTEGQNGQIARKEYPAYEVVTVGDIVEVIEHRRMEPVFYINDDPGVREELGLRK